VYEQNKSKSKYTSLNFPSIHPREGERRADHRIDRKTNQKKKREREREARERDNKSTGCYKH